LPPDVDDSQKKAVFDPLVANFVAALKLIFQSRAALLAGSTTADFQRRASVKNDPAVFGDDGSELIPEAGFDWKSEVIKIANEGRAYLRLYPSNQVPPFKTAFDARNSASQGGLHPMGTDLSGWTPARNAFGAIVYESPVNNKLYHLTQLFLSRELWGVDAFALNATHCKEFTPEARTGYIASTYVERVFTETLTNYLTFSKTVLNLPPLLQIEAGLTGIKGYPIALQYGFHGSILTDHVLWTGEIPSYELSAEQVLKPFFDYMWAECGVTRPEHV